MNDKTELSPQRQPQVEPAHTPHTWRDRVYEFAIALALALACAVLVDQAMRALAAPARPCDAAIHRLVVEPNPQPRCLTIRAEFPA